MNIAPTLNRSLMEKDEHDPYNIKHEVFIRVVYMCSSQILTRLGLKSSKRGTRRLIKDNFIQAIKYVKTLNSYQIEDLDIKIITELFLKTAKEIISLVNI
jgi:hypothetical protein